MYEGYLSFGGNEVINSARTMGYVTTSACGVNWLQCPPCEGINDTLNNGQNYNYATISTAPWYDAQDEASHRFLGVHGVTIENATDSTRAATATETIGNGGVVSRPRFGTRRMRIEAVLTAIGEDALEYGLAWLNTALIPRNCSVHGGTCGSADSNFYTACPPEFTDTLSTTDQWFAPVQNLYTNPSFESATGIPAGATRTTAWASRGTYSLNVPTSTKISIVTLTNQTFQVTARNAGQILTFGGVDYTATVAGAPIRVYGSGLVQFGLGWWDEVLVVAGNYTGPYFDGSMADSAVYPLADYAWLGTAHASISTYRTGIAIGQPDPVAHAVAVDKVERHLHTVTAVSGPTIVQKMHRGDAYGYLVEFVLVSGVPWTFGPTSLITSTPTAPSVIQDVPFNLVPSPSAELASGSVTAATNYSTNPSAELNTTSWARTVTGAVVAGDVVLSQSDTGSGGLASVGTKSARARFTASNTSTTGTFALENTSANFTAATGNRVSVNVWASSILTSGTAVIASTQVYAIWRAASSVLRTDLIGSVPAGGGAVTSKSISVPATADNVITQARVTLTSWSTGAVVDLYADAVAVTIP